jgi:hypothetical protein
MEWPLPKATGTTLGCIHTLLLAQHLSIRSLTNSTILLIFIVPCIVIYSCSITNKMHLLSQIICSCKTLYMFRTVFLSIIRRSKLHIQQLF